MKSTSIRVKTKMHQFSFNFLQTIVNNLKIYINKGVIRHLIERNATAGLIHNIKLHLLLLDLHGLIIAL